MQSLQVLNSHRVSCFVVMRSAHDAQKKTVNITYVAGLMLNFQECEIH